MNVICVIGDVVRSRDAENRARLQRTFQATLKAINRRGDARVLSPATITLGDEFQAIYQDASGLWADVWHLITELHPHQIRFALGIGPLSTPVNPKRAIGMDGPAFHVARDLMEGRLKTGGRLFGVAMAQEPAPGWIEAALDLVSRHVADWKPSRHRVFLRYLEGVPVKEAAPQVGLTPAAVYKNIAEGGLEPLAHLLNEISRWMNGQVKP